MYVYIASCMHAFVQACSASYIRCTCMYVCSVQACSACCVMQACSDHIQYVVQACLYACSQDYIPCLKEDMHNTLHVVRVMRSASLVLYCPAVGVHGLEAGHSNQLQWVSLPQLPVRQPAVKGG